MLTWRTSYVVFLVFFSLQYVGRYEFDELIVKDIKNFAAYDVQFGLLSWQIVLEHLNQLATTVHHVRNSYRT